MDGIFGIGPLELVLIAVIALIVLGPERLPTVIREGARYLREIRKLGSELTSQFSDELNMLDDINPRRIINEVLDPIQSATKPAPTAPPAQKPPKPAPAAATAAAVAPAVAVAPPDAAGNGANSSGDVQPATADEPANSILPPGPPVAVNTTEAPSSPSAPATPVETHAAPPPEIPA